MEPWGEYVEAVTQGRVTVDYYPEGALANFKDQFHALETGMVDMGPVTNTVMPGKWPLMELFSLPGFAKNELTNDGCMRELYDKYPCFTEQFGDKVVNILSHVYLLAGLHSVEPIRTLKELEGKIVACTDEGSAGMLNTLGASGTVITGSDAYLAAQTGVVDAIFAAWGYVDSYHFCEVTPYHIDLRLCPITISLHFNRETFERFTPLEQMLLKNYRYQGWFDATRGAVYQQERVLAQVPEEDMIKWSPEEMATVKALFRPYWDAWVDKVTALGYPGQAILDDAIFFVEGYERG